MNIVIVGTGNTATVLGKKILAAGHSIVQVYGRNPLSAGNLAYELSSKAVSKPEDLDTSADIFILAVSDHALESLALQLKLPGKLLLHTAGAVSLDVLKPSGADAGVLYPLQSMRSELQRLPPVPFAVDGDSDVTRSRVFDFASTISDQVFYADDLERARLHLAAVVVNNFTNHLLALTQEFCSREGIEFDYLLPLITETVARLEHTSAAAAQTGPAVRADKGTMARHLLLLHHHPQLKTLYKVLSESIMHTQGNAGE